MDHSTQGSGLTRALRSYYWYGRPLLVLAYLALLLAGRRIAHPLDLLLLLVLWCLPLWVRKRLLPAAHKRDPAFALRLEQALTHVDAQREHSKLPWVRAQP